MITVQLSNEEFAIELSGMSATLALRKRVAVPLSAIRRAYVAAPGERRSPNGFRLPGTAWPFGKNPIYYGQYRRFGGDGWEFWATNSDEPNQKLVVEVADVPGAGKFREIVVTVPSATEAAERINEARAALGASQGPVGTAPMRATPAVSPSLP